MDYFRQKCYFSFFLLKKCLKNFLDRSLMDTLFTVFQFNARQLQNLSPQRDLEAFT